MLKQTYGPVPTEVLENLTMQCLYEMNIVQIEIVCTKMIIEENRQNMHQKTK